MQTAVVVLLGSCIVADARVIRSQGFLAAGSVLQPQVVAHSLIAVENEWKSQASSFAECNSTEVKCDAAPSAFRKSCATVVSAVVQGSSGDKNTVMNYMKVVCAQPELEGWHRDRCTELSNAVESAMGEASFENREHFDALGMCGHFWSNFVVDERARVEQERAEEDAKAKKLAQERVEQEKKEAEEAALAAKKAAEEATEEAKRQVEEQKQHEREEVERKALEARKRAEEAAAELAAKREAAEKQAEEARHKMDEARQAAEEVEKNKNKFVLNGTQTKKNVIPDKKVALKVTTNTKTIANATMPKNILNSTKASIGVEAIPKK